MRIRIRPRGPALVLWQRHRAELAAVRAELAELRALIPVRRRERHAVARAAARPVARPPSAERPRCGARCRDGSPCAAPVVWPPGEGPRRRCRMHGGLSTGPRTPEGRARALAAIGQLPRDKGIGPVALCTRTWCAACALAARRCRSVPDWVRRQRVATLCPERFRDVLARALRWMRCRRHGTADVRALYRRGVFRVEFTAPGA